MSSSAITTAIPPTGQMLRDHTLVTETISRGHPLDPHPIFDANELSILRRFCADPSSKDTILKDVKMADQPGSAPGTMAGGLGSLAGYVVANDMLLEEEVARLREWFDKEKDGNAKL